LGCTQLPKEHFSSQPAAVSIVETRIISKGLLQISSSYTENMNIFHSRCSGALIHTPDLSLDSCVAVTAANCFHKIPKSALNIVEMIDGRGTVVKTYPVTGITEHPEFKAEEGIQTPAQAARDLALVEFNCTLPAAIQAGKLTDVTELSNTSRLYTAVFQQLEQPPEKKDFLEFISFGWYKKEKPAPVYKLTHNKMQFRNIETPDNDKLKTEKYPPSVVNIDPIQEPCDGQSGAPLFLEKDNELYLVGISSSGAGFCEKGKLRFTAAARHAGWMKEVLRTKDLLPPESSPISAVTPEPKNPKPESLIDLVLNLDSEPEAAFSQQLALTRTLPKSKGQKSDLNNREHLITRQTKTQRNPAKDKKISLSAKKTLPSPVIEEPSAIPLQDDEWIPDHNDSPHITSHSKKPETAKASVSIDIPPIPTAHGEDGSEPCMGVKLITQSKSRVWGTVVNLVDKDATQITDESLKCELPNGHVLCVVSNPAATGSGQSRAVLSQDITHNGCGKFYSGRIIYLYPSDFEIKQ
jgi:hypothetical protein